jgi:hypothetical protein
MALAAAVLFSGVIPIASNSSLVRPYPGRCQPSPGGLVYGHRLFDEYVCHFLLTDAA